LHDSEGFEPGEDAKLNTVLNFIEERSKRPDLSERPHAIWWVTYHFIHCKMYILFRICISVPVAGDRVAEIGVEQIIERVHGRSEFHVINSEPRTLKYGHAVPLIVVFTKYDMLVTPIIYRTILAARGRNTEQVWQNAEKEANKEFEASCVGPFTEAVLNKKVPVPIKKVSGGLMGIQYQLH
jgi:hypothetical protein